MTAKTTADRIEQDGQYQFNPANSDHEVLFNGRGSPQIKMIDLEGLFGLPEQRRVDVERQATDGGIPGTPFYGLRILTGNITVLADSLWDGHQAIMDLTESFQADDQDGVLIFQKPRVGKRLIYCRPSRLSIPSNSDVWSGIARGAVQWEAYDPRIYAFYEQTTTITLAPGENAGSADVYMGGNWRRGSPCRIQIDGPGTNVIVANNDDDNRQIRLDGAIGSGTSLMLDTGRLTVTNVATGDSERTRLARDNQWWELNKGANTISVSRTTTVGTLVVKVFHRDAFTL